MNEKGIKMMKIRNKFTQFNTDRDIVKLIMDIKYLKENVEKLNNDKQILKLQ